MAVVRSAARQRAPPERRRCWHTGAEPGADRRRADGDRPERADGEELAAADPAGVAGAGSRRREPSSRRNVTAVPAAAPSTPVITADVRAASGSNAAPTMPTTANAANPTTDAEARSAGRGRPSAAPHTSAATTIPMSSAVLSRSPNVRMAKPARGPASHTTRRDAIAPISEGRVRSMTAAESSTVASAHPAPTTPAVAAARTPIDRAGSAGPGPPPVATRPSQHACRPRRCRR